MTQSETTWETKRARAASSRYLETSRIVQVRSIVAMRNSTVVRSTVIGIALTMALRLLTGKS